MNRPLLNLAALCTITLGIILFCIIAGGYSSFSRSQDRIKEARSYLTEACEKRLVLFDELIELTDKASIPESEKPIKKTAQKAELILHQIISHTPPVDSHLIKEFELSQNMVSQQMVKLMRQLETRPGPSTPERIAALKKELSTVQDALFVAQKHYNSETNYFNTRIKMFPGFLIAKLFNLDNIKFTQISKNTFLSGAKTFLPAAS